MVNDKADPNAPTAAAPNATHRSLRSAHRAVRTTTSTNRRQRSQQQIERDNVTRRFRSRLTQFFQNHNHPDLVAWWNEHMRCSGSLSHAISLRMFFPKVPIVEVAVIQPALIQQLAAIETYILSVIPSSKFSPVCRFDSERRGVNIGCTVVNGGTYSNSISVPGTIARLPQIKKIINELKQCIRNIFDEAFADRPWYRDLLDRLKFYIKKIHGDDGLEMLFAGLPITGVWLSSVSNLSKVAAASHGHVDDNVFGCSYVLSTDQISGVKLAFSKQDNDDYNYVDINVNNIVAGQWSTRKHFNLFPAQMDSRISWVFYFDRRVLSIDKYVIVYN